MAVQTLTYGNKQFLNQNADIPATNKVQDTDMNEIKAVVNNNAIELTNTETYSLNETLTGKIWIDGKPIYRKVIYVPDLPNASALYVDTNISNIDFVFDVYGIASTNVPINAARPESSELEISAWYHSATNQIMVVAGNNRTGYSAYVIIEYTKTS